jgi:hypothetical protein
MSALTRKLDSPARDEIPDEDDDADDEQEMDETAGDVKCKEAERPEDQQDDRDRQKHGVSLLGIARVTVELRARSNG